jgi:hypothetical protein
MVKMLIFRRVMAVLISALAILFVAIAVYEIIIATPETAHHYPLGSDHSKSWFDESLTNHRIFLALQLIMASLGLSSGITIWKGRSYSLILLLPFLAWVLFAVYLGMNS